tara:strand:+ start:222 stop:863 length:642 start_codon:yes stop_codon:yes gene_type:complete
MSEQIKQDVIYKISTLYKSKLIELDYRLSMLKNLTDNDFYDNHIKNKTYNISTDHIVLVRALVDSIVINICAIMESKGKNSMGQIISLIKKDSELSSTFDEAIESYYDISKKLQTVKNSRDKFLAHHVHSSFDSVNQFYIDMSESMGLIKEAIEYVSCSHTDILNTLRGDMGSQIESSSSGSILKKAFVALDEKASITSNDSIAYSVLLKKCK